MMILLILYYELYIINKKSQNIVYYIYVSLEITYLNLIY